MVSRRWFLAGALAAGAIGGGVVAVQEDRSNRARPPAGGTYDEAVLADGPLLYLTGPAGVDRSGSGRHVRMASSPEPTTMPNGDTAFIFNGVDQYAEMTMMTPTVSLLQVG